MCNRARPWCPSDPFYRAVLWRVLFYCCLFHLFTSSGPDPFTHLLVHIADRQTQSIFHDLTMEEKDIVWWGGVGPFYVLLSLFLPLREAFSLHFWPSHIWLLNVIRSLQELTSHWLSRSHFLFKFFGATLLSSRRLMGLERLKKWPKPIVARGCMPVQIGLY